MGGGEQTDLFPLRIRFLGQANLLLFTQQECKDKPVFFKLNFF